MGRWRVAPDGGRPEGRDCAHVDGIGPAPEVGEPLCRECARRGWAWVGLRLCLTCGHLGCCDSSRGAHATAHYESTGHPIARCLGTGCARPGRRWAWCYADEVYLWPR
ncbi:UBP-type zinc finger domain-containing protein [Streptomyces actuosus]|uniref:UBP-type zinc finger domain-containing protein n=1 Tax=Streptomyces actuosus TaxID=1885 RepID=A0ABS2VIP7_STRAS|nr:UBP-type zinc finger domain-containing protein [Streptomyces actuosus]MBN0042947.1 UBP-type zinc finger domain-containing protein [Streptomyces actuosus]